jgi:hypothetical protein
MSDPALLGRNSDGFFLRAFEPTEQVVAVAMAMAPALNFGRPFSREFLLTPATGGLAYLHAARLAIAALSDEPLEQAGERAKPRSEP